MSLNNVIRHLALATLILLLLAGCERSTAGLKPYPLDTNPIVFDDNLPLGSDYQAFLGSKLDAVSIDTIERRVGAASMKVTVPPPGDPSGTYAGGAITSNRARNLTGYNAVTFWAKASKATASLDVAGLGNDNTGTSKFEASTRALQLTDSWQWFVIPIPRPDRLAVERGLFFFAEGPEDGVGFDVWFDEIRFENLPAMISNPRPFMTTQFKGAFVGQAVTVEGVRTTFDVVGTDSVTVEHSAGYFTFASSNPGVVSIVNNEIRVVGGGSAVITAKLDTVSAVGSVTVNATAPPTIPAPTPTIPASDVISLFSDAPGYVNVPVDTWLTEWSRNYADLDDIQIAGDNVKAYTNLVFAGIEFASQTIDATAMTHFHLDVFITSGSGFKVKLVDFGPDNMFGGGDDREHELSFNSSTTPSLLPGTWSSLDIPLADFVGLTTRANLAQLIISGAPTAFVDNVYFHK